MFGRKKLREAEQKIEILEEMNYTQRRSLRDADERIAKLGDTIVALKRANTRMTGRMQEAKRLLSSEEPNIQTSPEAMRMIQRETTKGSKLHGDFDSRPYQNEVRKYLDIQGHPYFTNRNYLLIPTKPV